MALMVPSMMPSRQINAFRQSGHQRRAAGVESLLAGEGASHITMTAMSATGMLQATKAACQLATIGSTTNISATGRISPISSPFV
jgi:hypothetical protein